MTMAVRRGDALTWRALPHPGQTAHCQLDWAGLAALAHGRNLGHSSAVERFFEKVLGHMLWLPSQDNLEGAKEKKSGLDFLLEEKC